MRKTSSVTLSDAQYAIFNGSEYADDVLDKKVGYIVSNGGGYAVSGLDYSRYGVLTKVKTAYRGFLEVAQIRRIFLDGYGVLDVRTVIFKCNKQVKDNKIDLFVQQYEQFSILDDESIDSAFSRFNTIITSLKALDESSSSQNHVRKFLRALPTKWRPKVTTIEKSKDLSTLSLDELIGNLNVYEVVLEKDSQASKNKKERYKSLALKAKTESSDEETYTSGSEDEEYVVTVRDFRRRGRFMRQPHNDKKVFQKVKEDKKGKGDRKCVRCGDLNHFISDCPKHSYSNQKEFVGGS
ncbi:zf-CCHC domain-containing protein [Tanacetum coccineum]